MVLTASKSARPAGRISTVLPSASSAYVRRPAWAMLISSSGSEVQPCDRPLGRWVGEFVADRHHALDVPDPGHQAVAKVRGLRGALDGHDPVGDGHGEQGRVNQEVTQDDVVDDLRVDFLVGAIEYGQQVGPADDADQVAARVDHGERLDLEGVHQPGGVL